jgi:phosphate transport system substrate-binding protein
MQKLAFVSLTVAAIALTGLPSCIPTIATSPSSTQTVADEQGRVRLGGSSSSEFMLKTIATAYENSTQAKAIVLEPGQSESVVLGVKQGLADIGAVSKTLKPTDLGDALTSRVIATDALLVATHPSVTGIKNLTTKDLKGIYSGQITNWKALGGPDAKIIVLDRPEDESAKKLLRKHYLGADLKTSPDAIVLRKEGELVAAIQSTAYSIGAFSLATAIAHQLPVNSLSLNAIEPTHANIQAGKYGMVRQIGLVWKKNPTAETQKLIDFAFSPEGLQHLRQIGLLPTAPR